MPATVATGDLIAIAVLGGFAVICFLTVAVIAYRDRRRGGDPKHAAGASSAHTIAGRGDEPSDDESAHSRTSVQE